jgi:hypothetical protein
VHRVVSGGDRGATPARAHHRVGLQCGASAPARNRSSPRPEDHRAQEGARRFRLANGERPQRA